uniref:Uncharacterized protein n=1 Tax=Fagus sylvatica TaxID=28930 RepID=A0A2N9F9N6_FAGSY
MNSLIATHLQSLKDFVYSATPAIASSCVYEKCTVCMDDQLSHGFLCRHQIPNVSLRAVWNWYEKPGNYGLDVKAEDSQNLNGLPIESTSFRAHFVPFLSADRGEVESHVSFPKIVFVKRSSDAVEVNHCLKDDIETAVNFDSVEEPVSSSKFSPCNESDDLGSDRLTTYCDTDLIFEFFESEQPQHRKTLHDKIVELIDVGISNYQVYGDPSKLEVMNLNELHPASWFSVAWYPIYRIPEGNFRASFLTYHSLGHLVQRPILTDSLDKKRIRHCLPCVGIAKLQYTGFILCRLYVVWVGRLPKC